MSMLPVWFWACAAFSLGAVLGSFLALCGERLSAGASIVRPGSTCPVCGTALTVPDLLPIASFLLLKGRCRHCGAPISPVSFVFELGLGLTCMGLYLAHGAAPRCVLDASAICLAALAGDIDRRTEYLPDKLVLPACALWPGAALVTGLPLDLVLRHVIWGLLACGAFFLVRVLFRLTRGTEGLGLGDVKLALFLGLASGPAVVAVIWTASAAALAAAGLAAAARSHRRAPGYCAMHIPYGPWAALALSLNLALPADLFTLAQRLL